MLSGSGAARPNIDFGGNAPETAGNPARAEVEAELARLLASDKISRNANSARFLRYVVEETLAGRGERLKAFSIATQALGRPDDFNPQSDSIVRVQAVRVRAQLEDYYAGPGAADPLRILLPKGSYQPRFECPVAARPAGAELTLVPPAPPPPLPAPAPAANNRHIAPAANNRHFAAAGLFLMCVALLALVVFELLWEPAAPVAASGPPVLEIVEHGAKASGPLGSAADHIFAHFTNDVAGGEDVRILRAQEAAKTGDYALEGRFTGTGLGRFDVDFVLTERRSREVVWSRTFADVGVDDRARQEAVAHSVAALTIDMGGALLSDLYRRLHQTGPPLTGFYCKLTALNFLLLRREEGRPAARECLERQIERDPEDIRGLSLLSTLLVVGFMEDFPDSKGEIDVQRALQLSRRAYDLKPGGLVAMASLYYARFADRRYEDAFAFAPLLLEKNPNSLLVMLRLGRGFVSRGHYAEGVEQLEKMEARFGAPQPSATAYLALAALMRDDRAALNRYTTRVAAEATPLGLLLAMIGARLNGDAVALATKRERLRLQFPRFFANFPAAFHRYGLAPDIAVRLTKELTALGLAPPDGVTPP